MTTWSIVLPPDLLAQLNTKEQEFAESLETIHDKGTYRTSPDELAAEGEAFEIFRDAIEALSKSSDPKNSLTFFTKDSNDNRYYRLKYPHWDAYYFIREIDAKGEGIALLTLYKSKLSKNDILAMLESALAKYRQCHG